jgi:hypothetical protein
LPEEAQAASVAPEVVQVSTLPERVKLPVTKSQPSRGPADALVTIVQFCDLRGATCRASGAALEALIAKYGDDLRWVHRHRLTIERREESRGLHQLARAAFQQAGKFWELRALTLALPDDRILQEADYERLAQRVGLDYASARAAIDDRHFDPTLQLDDHFAKKFGVPDQVGYFVNGRALEAPARADFALRLAALVEEEMSIARALVAGGTARADVYTELTKDGAFNRAADGTLSARASGAR